MRRFLNVWACRQVRVSSSDAAPDPRLPSPQRQQSRPRSRTPAPGEDSGTTTPRSRRKQYRVVCMNRNQVSCEPPATKVGRGSDKRYFSVSGSELGPPAAGRNTCSTSSDAPHHLHVIDTPSSESVSAVSTRLSPARSECQNSLTVSFRTTSNRVRLPHRPQRRR